MPRPELNVKEDEEAESSEESEKEEFGELLKFTAGGFLGGFLLGILLDYLGLQRSPEGAR